MTHFPLLTEGMSVTLPNPKSLTINPLTVTIIEHLFYPRYNVGCFAWNVFSFRPDLVVGPIIPGKYTTREEKYIWSVNL